MYVGRRQSIWSLSGLFVPSAYVRPARSIRPSIDTNVSSELQTRLCTWHFDGDSSSQGLDYPDTDITRTGRLCVLS